MKNTTSLFNILHPLLGGRKKTIALATLLLFGFAGGAQAQSSTFSYQGYLQSGGTGFTGAGQFKFALVTVTNYNHTATATATISGTFVTIIYVTSGGSGYVTPPAVTISGGGGSGATATASMTGDAVGSITVNSPGSGYTSAPTVTIAPPPENLSYTTYWSNDGSSSAGGEPATSVSLLVNNGLFTACLGDTALVNMTALPGDLFQQPDLHLRIWFSDSVHGFAALNPAQPLTAAPYAFAAGSAASLSSGIYGSAVAFNNPANTFIGSGAGLTALNASELASGTLPDARLAANVARVNQVWLLGGNPGTTPGTHFLGTTDNQALEFKVNGARALRLEDNGDGSDSGTTPDGAPNLIGGSRANFVAQGVVGATISGGGAFNYAGSSSYTNAVLADYATVGGGLANRVDSGALAAAIAGGDLNDIGINSGYSAVGGGYNNNVAPSSSYVTIAGGYRNDVGTNSGSSAIGGGYDNNVAAYSEATTIAGGYYNDIGTNSDYSAIGGGYNNNVAAHSLYATIAGGRLNDIGTDSDYSAVGGGYNNNVADDSLYATIAGGYYNDIGTNSGYSAIGGGYNNNVAANSPYATIAGGYLNDIGAGSTGSAIGGGDQNTILDNSLFGTIPGGLYNTATTYAFAAGLRAKALHPGSFVWADSSDVDQATWQNNQFMVRASGGVRFFTNPGSSTGSYLNPGGSSWLVVCDRNVKKNFRPVDCREILNQLMTVPITRWNYKSEPDEAVAHLGPMAQDFISSFYPGADDKGIETMQFDGVALAAIQGLNQKLTEELKRRDAENAELRQTMTELKELVKVLNDKLNGGAE